ncbi:hypothetical protein DAMA08_042660 [Martiniozyma asiatica (nom. inval.)]|nr:hypothetical protein DAMA08_042660 [Martiniozyma asiatica]
MSSYFKFSDDKSLRDDYIDQTIDRERKVEIQSKWSKYNVFNAFNWYPSHYSSCEKKFLLKFDGFILLFLCFSFYTKYLDNSNVGTAYVSGMKEDLNLKGNELNYINTCYTVGYAIFQIPITMLFTKPKYSRHIILFCELAWGLMTLANAYVTNVQQMYVIRFFIGVFEASSFPVAYVILSSYLHPDELFKRCGFYGAWAAAGIASAGALQSSAMKHLDGINGMAGWRWQFIINAVITFGVFLFGFFFFPGIPTSCSSFGFFTEDDMTFARKRVEKVVNTPKKWTLLTFKDTFLTWQIYLCALLWILHGKAWYANGDQLYMKSAHHYFKGTEVTTWDSYIQCIGIISSLIVPPLCAYYGKMIPTNAICFVAYYSAIILIIWDVPNNVLMSSFFLQPLYTSGIAQVFYSWFAVLCRDNVEKKAIVLSFALTTSYAVNAFSTPLQYNIKNSPSFKNGYIANLIILICAHLSFFAIWFLEKYDTKVCPKIAGNRANYKEISIISNIDDLENAKTETIETTIIYS